MDLRNIIELQDSFNIPSHKDHAIGFANWINTKRYVGMNSRWYTSHIADTLVASSTEELYTLYLETL